MREAPKLKKEAFRALLPGAADRYRVTKRAAALVVSEAKIWG